MQSQTPARRPEHPLLPVAVRVVKSKPKNKQKTMKLVSSNLLVAWVLLGAWTALANSATLTFTDPAAEQGDAISTVGDIVEVKLDLDLLSGAYTAQWTASAGHPFQGNIRFNLNLGNPAVGPQIVALFQEFHVQQPTTHLSYSGVNSSLTFWRLGDTVVTHGTSPTFSTSFNSGNVNLDNPDVSDRDTVLQSAVITVPAPEPITLLANYTFDGSGVDRTGNNLPMELRNTSFANGTLCLNGIYEGSAPQGFHAVAQIPNVSYESFTVAMDFSPVDFASNNLLTGGTSYRWFSLRHNAGKLEVTLNNQRLSYLLPDSELRAGEWQNVVCSVNASAKTIITVLNGVRLQDITLSPDFHFEVAGSPADKIDRYFTFSNYSDGSVFHGCVDNLKVWSRALSSSEVATMVASPALTIEKAVLVSWSMYPRSVLQSSTDIAGPYQNYTGSIFSEGAQYKAAIPLYAPTKFFRLVNP